MSDTEGKLVTGIKFLQVQSKRPLKYDLRIEINVDFNPTSYRIDLNSKAAARDDLNFLRSGSNFNQLSLPSDQLLAVMDMARKFCKQYRDSAPF